jgi:hypothetical protein
LINLNEQHTNIKDKINKLDNTINSESQFKCLKINANCPFIQDINKKTFEELRKQKDNFDQEKIVIEKKIKNIQDEINDKKKFLDSLISNQSETNEIKKNLIKEKNDLEKTIKVLRQFLSDIDFKNIQNKYQETKMLLNQISALDKEILQLED